MSKYSNYFKIINKSSGTDISSQGIIRRRQWSELPPIFFYQLWFFISFHLTYTLRLSLPPPNEIINLPYCLEVHTCILNYWGKTSISISLFLSEKFVKNFISTSDRPLFVCDIFRSFLQFLVTPIFAYFSPPHFYLRRFGWAVLNSETLV